MNANQNDQPGHRPSHLRADEADLRQLLVALVKLALVDAPSETAAWRTDAVAVQDRIANGAATIEASRLDDLWSMAVKVAESDPVVRRDSTANPMLPTMSPLSLGDLKMRPFDLDATLHAIRDVSSFG